MKIVNVEGKGGLLDDCSRLNYCSFDQFLRWREYYNLEPFGDEREDLRIGALISTIYNVNMDLRKTRPYRPYNYVMGKADSGDFILAFHPNTEKQISNSKKPLTDPNEWKKTIEMAKVLSGAYTKK